MNDAEFAKLMALIDCLWSQNDPVYEAGFKFLLADEPYELVEATVREIAEGRGEPRDLTWMPKPPELYVRVSRLKSRRAQERRWERRCLELQREAARELAPAESVDVYQDGAHTHWEGF